MRVVMFFLYYSPHPHIPSYMRVGVGEIIEKTHNIYMKVVVGGVIEKNYNIYMRVVVGGVIEKNYNIYMRVVMCFLYYSPNL
jgi:hypothetical protein